MGEGDMKRHRDDVLEAIINLLLSVVCTAIVFIAACVASGTITLTFTSCPVATAAEYLKLACVALAFSLLIPLFIFTLYWKSHPVG